MKKILLIGSGILTTIILLLLVTFFVLLQKGKPLHQGKVSLDSLSEQVSLTYDKNGIPHIEAQNEADAYRALGYAMATDRLLQMDLMRRVSQGRLSELVGEKALATDKLFRTLALTENYRRQKRENLLDPLVEKNLAAFIEGVNAFVESGEYPFEYFFLGGGGGEAGKGPQAFTVEDCYSILGYMAYSFAMGLKTDLFYEFLNKEGKEREAKSLWAYPPQERMGFESTLFYRGNKYAQELVGLFTGSNAWALSRKRTKNKKGPLLASDPHVRFSSPGLWYEAHIKWPGGEYYGHFVPLLPFAAMAHNKDHGWGVTISYVDDMDFSYERYNEARDSVESAEGLSPLKIMTSKIKIKGKDPITWTTRFGPRGPLIENIISDALKEKSFLALEKNQGLSMKWGHYHAHNSGMKTLYYGQRAKNSKEFEKAMAHAGSPGLNIIYANKKEDLIARYIVGTVYRRHGVSARSVNKGWLLSEESQKHWQPVPFEKRPHLRNPESGVVVSANQKPEGVEEQFPGYFHPMDRYHTIHHLLEGQELWSAEELKLVQTASTNVFFFSHRDRIGELTADADLSRYEREVRDWFMQWQGLSGAKNGQAFLFYKFIEHFRRAAFSELSDKEFYYYCTLNDFSFALFRRLYEGRYRGAAVESFKRAISELKEKYGTEFKTWQLGKEHLLTFPHPLGRASQVLAAALDHGPYPVDGGFHQINHMREIGCEKGLKVEAGPSTRRIIDFAAPEESYGILPMGNSGHRASPFLFDQWELFRTNKYRKQIMRDLESGEIYGKVILLN